MFPTPRTAKLAVLVIGLACVIAGAIYGFGGAKSLGLPPLRSDRIVAVPEKLEYRDGEDSSNGIVEFRLHNEGSRRVKILGVTASCGCTMLDGEQPKAIEPGGDVKLTFRVSLGGFGTRESLVKIQTDSVETPLVRVNITVSGKKLTPPYVWYAPSSLRVQSVAQDAPAPLKLQITCIESPGEPWLTGVKDDNGLVSSDPPTVTRELPYDAETVSREYDVTLNIQPPSAGETTRTIQLTPITRTEPVQPFPYMSLTWEQVDVIRAAPASLLFSFAADDADAEKQRRIVLVAADEAEWTITSITSDADWLRAVEVNKDGRESRNRQLNVVCTRPADASDPLESSVVRIATNHPRCPEVLVRVNRVNRDDPRTKSAALETSRR